MGKTLGILIGLYVIYYVVNIIIDLIIQKKKNIDDEEETQELTIASEEMVLVEDEGEDEGEEGEMESTVEFNNVQSQGHTIDEFMQMINSGDAENMFENIEF